MNRHFEHSARIWANFPTLVPSVMLIEGLTPDADVTDLVVGLGEAARARLAVSTEADFPEVQAWRRAFTLMGLRPTQYRCASESLLMRYRKEGSLPRLHPLVDLCNATSIAFDIPVAAFDTDLIMGDLQVRHASGDDDHLSFSGENEHTEPGEVIFADSAGQATPAGGPTGRAAPPPSAPAPPTPSSSPRHCTPPHSPTFRRCERPSPTHSPPPGAPRRSARSSARTPRPSPTDPDRRCMYGTAWRSATA